MSMRQRAGTRPRIQQSATAQRGSQTQLAPDSRVEHLVPSHARLARQSTQDQAVADVAPETEAQVAQLHGGGQALDAATRSFMEPRFGHDFSQVRVHTDQRAASTAGALDARAFTLGNDIAFAPGEYQPGSDSGRQLLAHELTHTIQQTGGAQRVQRDPEPNAPPESPVEAVASAPGGGNRPMIRRGSQGQAVMDAQELLNQHGAMPPLVVDGIFGPLTHQATVTFQNTSGLDPDGIIGPLTWGALESSGPGPGPEPPGPQPPGPGPEPPGPQPPVPPLPIERWGPDDRAMIDANTIPGVLTSHQASRVEPAVQALLEMEYFIFRDLLDAAGSDMERAFLCKALAAARTTADITTFADTIRGMSDNWLLRNLNVIDFDESDGVEQGIIQQFGNSCGPTSVQVIRASADPIYALELRSAGPIEQASQTGVSAPDTVPNDMLANEQKAILDSHAAAGTGNAATDRANPTGGAWVESDMNALAAATGVTYQTKIVGTDIPLNDAIDVLKNALNAGIHVPLVVGGSVGDTAHYVMAMAISGDRIQIHDVWSGDTVWRTEQEFKDSDLHLPSLHTMLTAIDEPTTIPAAP